MWLRHCSAEFMKHVLPRLERPTGGLFSGASAAMSAFDDFDGSETSGPGDGPGDSSPSPSASGAGLGASAGGCPAGGLFLRHVVVGRSSGSSRRGAGSSTSGPELRLRRTRKQAIEMD